MHVSRTHARCAVLGVPSNTQCRGGRSNARNMQLAFWQRHPVMGWLPPVGFCVDAWRTMHMAALEPTIEI